MNTYETLELSRAGDTLTVTLNRPRRANAVNRQMLKDLIALAEELQDHDDIVFVVFRGGERVFSAGADLNELVEELAHENPRPLVRSMQNLGQEMMRKLESVEQITVAALHGSAYGAGLAIALTTDFRIMADTAVASLPETKIGMFLTYGCTPRLTGLIGAARAKEMIMFADDVPAAQCLEWGVATDVVPADRVDARVAEVVNKLRDRDRVALRVTKKLVRAASAPVFGELTASENEIVDGVFALGDVARKVDEFVESKKQGK